MEILEYRGSSPPPHFQANIFQSDLGPPGADPSLAPGHTGGDFSFEQLGESLVQIANLSLDSQATFTGIWMRVGDGVGLKGPLLEVGRGDDPPGHQFLFWKKKKKQKKKKKTDRGENNIVRFSEKSAYKNGQRLVGADSTQGVFTLSDAQSFFRDDVKNSTIGFNVKF